MRPGHPSPGDLPSGNKQTSTDPRSRQRAERRRASPVDGRCPGDTSTKSTAPTKVATTGAHWSGCGAFTTTKRSRATPNSNAAAKPMSLAPTTATHEPVWVARAIRASAIDRAPAPETPTVTPRRRPSGNSPARASSTGRVRSTASVVGRIRWAVSANADASRNGRPGRPTSENPLVGSGRSSGGRSSKRSGSASRLRGRVAGRTRDIAPVSNICSILASPPDHPVIKTRPATV